MFIHVKVLSKNLNELHYFLRLFNYINFNTKLKTKNFFKIQVPKKKIKFFSILRSPHVNKSAQIQFGITIYKKSIVVYSNKTFKFLV